ncbi:hypothetical protein HJFPF1_02596 [Paramyrothecium foliicola]|nr:hypothetical protein HJFPF1_02596 [Paramyrothecium foliicola]
MSRRPNDFGEDHEGVSYASSNKTNRASFSATSPPNSQHAARLARLAMMVQRPPHSTHDTYGAPQQHLIREGATVRALTQGPDRRGEATVISDRPEFPEDLPTRGNEPSSRDPYTNPRYGMAAANDQRLGQRASLAASWVPEPPPEVTRYRNEERTTYVVQGRDGVVKVSAPVGCSEAELFDAIARAQSVPSPKDQDTKIRGRLGFKR